MFLIGRCFSVTKSGLLWGNGMPSFCSCRWWSWGQQYRYEGFLVASVILKSVFPSHSSGYSNPEPPHPRNYCHFRTGGSCLSGFSHHCRSNWDIFPDRWFFSWQNRYQIPDSWVRPAFWPYLPSEKQTVAQASPFKPKALRCQPINYWYLSWVFKSQYSFGQVESSECSHQCQGLQAPDSCPWAQPLEHPLQFWAERHSSRPSRVCFGSHCPRDSE